MSPSPPIDPALLKALCAFADALSHLPDPRGVRYSLAVLLGTLLVALAGGANTMAAVAEFTADPQAWFRQWLPLGESVPTDDTYRLLVRRLEPETAVKAALLLLDGDLPARPAGADPGPGRQVLAPVGRPGRGYAAPAPGQRLPGAGGADPGPGALRGQEQTKSRPSPACSSAWCWRGAVVTIDAAGCQRAIVQDLQAAGADYVLAVKRNQPTLHAEVHAAFAEAERGAFTPEVQDECETVERNGTVLGGPGLCEWVADPADWPGLRSLIRVHTERNGPDGRQRSVRYYISSRPVDAEALLALVRGHWGVENGLHRTLGRGVPGGRLPPAPGPRPLP